MGARSRAWVGPADHPRPRVGLFTEGGVDFFRMALWVLRLQDALRCFVLRLLGFGKPKSGTLMTQGSTLGLGPAVRRGVQLSLWLTYILNPRAWINAPFRTRVSRFERPQSRHADLGITLLGMLLAPKHMILVSVCF